MTRLALFSFTVTFIFLSLFGCSVDSPVGPGPSGERSGYTIPITTGDPWTAFHELKWQLKYGGGAAERKNAWDDWRGKTGNGDDPYAHYNVPAGEWEIICRSFEKGCKLRFQSEWSSADMAAISSVISYLNRSELEHCRRAGRQAQSLLALDQIGLWDARVHRGEIGYPLYGRVAIERPGQPVLLWSGKGSYAADRVDWIRTLAHEALHKVHGFDNPLYPESVVHNLAGHCSPNGGL